jgi:predicted nucleotidyltransferase
MVDLITDDLPAIRALCEKHGVRKLEVFGSTTLPYRFDHETSDVDFIIEFADRGPGYADRFFRFAEDIEAQLGRDADFVFGNKPIKNPHFRAAVNDSRMTIFESRDRQAAA